MYRTVLSKYLGMGSLATVFVRGRAIGEEGMPRNFSKLMHVTLTALLFFSNNYFSTPCFMLHNKYIVKRRS